MRLIVCILALACNDAHLCDKPEPVRDATESLEPTTVSWLQDQLDAFDEATRRPMCIDLVAWRRPMYADDRFNTVTTRVTAAYLNDGRSHYHVATALCQAAMLIDPPDLDDVEADPFWDSTGFTPADPEPEERWLASCALTQRADVDIRRRLQAACDANTWSSGLDAAQALWRDVPSPRELTKSSPRQVTTKRATRVFSLQPQPMFTTQDGASQILHDGENRLDIRSLSPLHRALWVHAVVDRRAFLISPDAGPTSQLWAFDLDTRTLEHIDTLRGLFAGITPVSGGVSYATLAYSGSILNVDFQRKVFDGEVRLLSSLQIGGLSTTPWPHAIAFGPADLLGVGEPFDLSPAGTRSEPSLSWTVGGASIQGVGAPILGHDDAYWSFATTADADVIIMRSHADQPVHITAMCADGLFLGLFPDGAAVSAVWSNAQGTHTIALGAP